MPLYLEPDLLFPVVLDSDKDKIPCPTFWAQSQSMRGQAKTAAVLDAWNGQIDASELFARTIEELKRVVVKCENMPAFEWDLLTYSEARELLRKVMFNQHLDTQEKKD